MIPRSFKHKVVFILVKMNVVLRTDKWYRNSVFVSYNVLNVERSHSENQATGRKPQTSYAQPSGKEGMAVHR
jgi:hypothetical protein